MNKPPRIGRHPLDGAENLKRVNFTIREDQHQKVLALGGSVWLRARIDGAGKLEHALEEIRLFAAQHEEEEWAKAILRLCDNDFDKQEMDNDCRK